MHYLLCLTGLILSTFFLNAQDAYDSEVLLKKSHYQIKENKLIITDSITLMINNKDGEGDALISIPFSKGDKITIGNAWIEDMDGNIVRKLKNKDITDRNSISNISLYEDDFVKEFSLNHNQYPYLIKYSYKIIYPRFFQITSLDYSNLQKQTPIREAIISVETPSDNTIRYTQKNIPDPEIKKLAESTLYTWTFAVEPQKAERLASINNTTQPQLSIVPLTFNYGTTGSSKSWNTFGNWIYRLNEGRDVLPPYEQKKIDELTKNTTDKKEKIRILYHYLQDYNRYINVSLNIGGLQTYPAEYVTINRYGDCKALTNYMQSMLKYVGIESFYTLINSSSSVKDIDPDFPRQAFNHAILSVPVNNDTLYLECTSKTLPLGYIHTSIQGRKALLVSENNSRLINIPSLTPENVLCNSTSSTTISTNTYGQTSTTVTSRGSDFEESSYVVLNTNKSDCEKYFIKNIVSKNIERPTLDIPTPVRDSLYYRFDVKGYTSSSLFKIMGKNISIVANSLSIPTLESIESRKRDVQINYPIYETDNCTYEIQGQTIDKTPQNIEIESPYGKYSVKYTLSDNKLNVSKSLLLKSGRYSIEEYPDFFNFIQKIRNIEIRKHFIEIL